MRSGDAGEMAVPGSGSDGGGSGYPGRLAAAAADDDDAGGGALIGGASSPGVAR